MDDVSLAYLLAHPGSLGLSIDQPFLLLAAGLAALFFTRSLPGAVSRRVVLLRSAAFTAIVASIAGVNITTKLPANQLTLVAAVDVSGSIDDPGLSWSEEYLRSVRSSLAPGDQLAVVTFAESPEIASTAAPDEALPAITRPQNVAATDIAAAFDQALALFPQGSQKAVLLLSDGNETSGDSRSRIETLRALQVRVHAVSPPRVDSADIRLARLAAPTVVAAERPLPLRVVIRNSGGPRAAVLNLYLDGLLSDSVALTLDKPLQTFDALLRVSQRGGHIIRAEIASDGDTHVENNSREVSVIVRGETAALLATRHRHSLLADVIRRRGVDVTVVRPGGLPTRSEEYAARHLVVLEDLRARDIGKDAASALEEFVRVHGGGLIFAGGGASFGDREFQGTPLEKLLPVTLEPRRPKPGKRDPLALFLVIDRSNSMGFNSRIGTLRDGEKLRYAIKAGVEVIKQLKDHDRVGVIAFDARPHEISPLLPLKANRGKLLDALPRIVESGGTDFFDALTSAADQLSHSRVSRKHIVLLTDGDTNRAGRGEYRPLIEKLAVSGISVTTIRIGDNTVNLKLLQEISEGTGGSFHHVANAEMLPDLMLRDTSRALQPLTPEAQRFLPAFGTIHQILAGTEEAGIPHLADYAFSKPKPFSETVLHVARSDRRDPILSVWRYGLGRVAAFTASPSDDAEAWPAWSGFARLWSQLAFWTARMESDDDLAIEATRRGDRTHMLLQTFHREDIAATISAEIDAGDQTIAIHFSPNEPGIYDATTVALAPGRYPLRIRERAGSQLREVETVVAVPSQPEDARREYAHTSDNRELLRDLTDRTGGTLGAAAAEVTRRPKGSRSVSYPLAGVLIPLAMCAFLADIALRRITSLRAG